MVNKMKSIIQIYNDLLELCNKTEAFTYKDQYSVAGGLYRVFSYRLASYSDFLHESAFEGRGSMWEIREDGSLIRCAARTQLKFFNAYENPFVMFPSDMLSSEIAIAMDKLDGSIISTFRDIDGVIRTKSQTSLSSEHAINSNALIQNDVGLLNGIEEAEHNQYTVNLEYTSPEFRIVLPYQEEKLTVLNVRHRITGEVLAGEALQKRFPTLYERSVSADKGNIDPAFPMRETLKQSIEAAYEMKDIEGFVVQLKDGRMFKVKTNWYCALHFTKDSINIDSRLYEAVLNGGSDDLRQMFSTDDYCMKKIDRMENLVFSCYNKLQHDVETFVNNHKHLERKDFALVVQKTLPKELNAQGLAFALYNGKPVDFKETLLKYSKDVLANF